MLTLHYGFVVISVLSLICTYGVHRAIQNVPERFV